MIIILSERATERPKRVLSNTTQTAGQCSILLPTKIAPTRPPSRIIVLERALVRRYSFEREGKRPLGIFCFVGAIELQPAGRPRRRDGCRMRKKGIDHWSLLCYLTTGKPARKLLPKCLGLGPSKT